MVELKGKAKKTISDMKKNYQGYIFMLPLVIGICLFNIVPMIQSLAYSFMDYDMMFKMDFIRFENYIDIFTVDFSGVLASLVATFSYTIISVPISMILSYMLALLLNTKTKGVGIFRVLVYIPCVIPPIASALLWKDMFDPTYGIMNRILQMMQLPTSTWLSSGDTALSTMILMSMWGLGGGMILWLASFKNIPETLYEAANIEGAGAITKFVKITIPMTTPIIFYNLLTSLIGSLQIFSSFLMIPAAEMSDSIYFFAVRIYNEAFTKFNMGYASALAWILFIIIAALSLVMFRFNKWVFFGDDA